MEQTETQKFTDVELTTKAIVAFDFLNMMSASAEMKNVSLEHEFEAWKREVKRNPSQLSNPYMEHIGVKYLDDITVKMVVDEYHTMIENISNGQPNLQKLLMR